MANLNIAIEIAAKDQASGPVGQIQNALGGLGKTAGTMAAGALALVGTALAGIGVAGVAAGKEVLGFADDLNVALRDVERRSGRTTEEMDAFGDSLRDIYSDARVVDKNLEEMADGMDLVSRTTGETGDDLEELSIQAMVLGDRFEMDLAENMRTVDALLKNNIAPNAEAALDIITVGMQNNLNVADDFLDTLTEYAQDFDELGLTGEQTLNLLNSGLEAGIFNTDKIGDATQEFLTSLKDVGVVEKLQEINPALAEIAMAFNEGRISGVEALTQIQTELAAMDDSLARNEAGRTLFVSFWDDLGEEALMALDPMGQKLGDIEGATTKATEANLSLRDSISQLGREFLVALEPAGQEILPLLNSGIDQAGQFMAAAKPIFAEFSVELRDTLGPAMLLVEDALRRIGIALGLATEDAEGMDVALAALKTTLDLVVTAIEAVAIAAQGLAWVFEQAREAYDMAVALHDQLVQINQLSGGSPTGATLDYLSDQLAGFLAQTSQSWFGFAEGGMVPGPVGSPQLAMVHGGELILNPQQQQGLRQPLIGSPTIYANDAAGGQAAGRAFVDELRSRGMA